MRRIGITGTIASGKTTVSILLRRRGFSVFNADNYAKMATHAGNPCFERLIEVVGEDVKDANGDIDRAKMASVIFHDEEKRKAVNAIVHPYVKDAMNRFFENHQDDLLVFAEVPLLFEAKMESCFDTVCVVTCSKETAVKRMMEDREYTEEEALSRYHSQFDPEYQKEKADKVIYNETDLKELDHQVNLWVGEMRKAARHGHQA